MGLVLPGVPRQGVEVKDGVRKCLTCNPRIPAPSAGSGRSCQHSRTLYADLEGKMPRCQDCNVPLELGGRRRANWQEYDRLLQEQHNKDIPMRRSGTDRRKHQEHVFGNANRKQFFQLTSTNAEGPQPDRRGRRVDAETRAKWSFPKGTPPYAVDREPIAEAMRWAYRQGKAQGRN